MDAFAALPAELLPMLLATPICVVAMRLTCKRLLAEVPAALFKKRSTISWGSDYWTVMVVISTHARFGYFQNGYPSDVCIFGEPSATWNAAKYILACYINDRPAFIYMGPETGINRVEDSENIYYPIGQFGGGPLTREEIVTGSPMNKDIEAIAAFKTQFTYNGRTCGCASGTFEFVSKFIDAADDVVIYRRR